jgi:hypothetical protein
MQRFERKQPAPGMVWEIQQSLDFQCFVDYGIAHTSLDRHSMPPPQL